MQFSGTVAGRPDGRVQAEHRATASAVRVIHIRFQPRILPPDLYRSSEPDRRAAVQLALRAGRPSTTRRGRDLVGATRPRAAGRGLRCGDGPRPTTGGRTGRKNRDCTSRHRAGDDRPGPGGVRPPRLLAVQAHLVGAAGARPDGRTSGAGSAPSSSRCSASARLLKWSVPGLAHFFTFWAFVILITVYLEAYGALFVPDFHIPLIGRWPVLGFLQDVIAAAALISLGVFSVIRLRNDPRAPGPGVAVLRLAHRRRLADPVHDLQRAVDDVPVPRRVGGAGHLPLRVRGVRLDRRRPAAVRHRAGRPVRAWRASGCCCTSA